MIWSKSFRSGEEAMCHSLQNIEHHHFKFEGHRSPGDVHVHFFGTAALSFGDGVKLQDGDVMQVASRASAARCAIRFVWRLASRFSQRNSLEMRKCYGKPRVAILGLGIMGSGMAGRVFQRGFPLVVYNRNRDKAGAARRKGRDGRNRRERSGIAGRHYHQRGGGRRRFARSLAGGKRGAGRRGTGFSADRIQHADRWLGTTTGAIRRHRRNANSWMRR